MKNGALTIVLFLVATLLGSAAFATLGPGERRPSRDEASEWMRIRASLDEMATTLARLERSLERGRDPKESRIEAPEGGEGLASLRAEVARMADAVQALGVERSVPATREPAASLNELVRRRPEVDWLALDGVVHEWRHDPDSAGRSLLFLTSAELVSRFGAPTRVHDGDEGEERWTYGNDPNAPRDYRLTLSLSGGHVTRSRINAP